MLVESAYGQGEGALLIAGRLWDPTESWVCAWQQVPLSPEHSHWPWIINSLLWDKDDILQVWFWSLVIRWRKKRSFAVPAGLPCVPGLETLSCVSSEVTGAALGCFAFFSVVWSGCLVSGQAALPSFPYPSAVRTSTCHHAWLRFLVQVFNSFTKIVIHHMHV